MSKPVCIESSPNHAATTHQQRSGQLANDNCGERPHTDQPPANTHDDGNAHILDGPLVESKLNPDTSGLDIEALAPGHSYPKKENVLNGQKSVELNFAETEKLDNRHFFTEN
ncbi:hypothetical protein AVEN_124046-1 [Araneus ventricosus]|uniref:Uncharacterized protein n=1 Tax=Araneus ventricosus TaxID=182803 RepID=A0A4Y2KMC7_ARAVE|nr:hypothetical protein AVEN_124046-1 [Araneus ventricosus]